MNRDCQHGRQQGKCSDCDIEILEQENRSIRARNERLERLPQEIVARLEQGFGAGHAAPMLIRREFMDAALENKHGNVS